MDGTLVPTRDHAVAEQSSTTSTAPQVVRSDAWVRCSSFRGGDAPSRWRSFRRQTIAYLPPTDDESDGFLGGVCLTGDLGCGPAHDEVALARKMNDEGEFPGLATGAPAAELGDCLRDGVVGEVVRHARRARGCCP